MDRRPFKGGVLLYLLLAFSVVAILISTPFPVEGAGQWQGTDDYQVSWPGGTSSSHGTFSFTVSDSGQVTGSGSEQGSASYSDPYCHWSSSWTSDIRITGTADLQKMVADLDVTYTLNYPAYTMFCSDSTGSHNTIVSASTSQANAKFTLRLTVGATAEFTYANGGGTDRLTITGGAFDGPCSKHFTFQASASAYTVQQGEPVSITVSLDWGGCERPVSLTVSGLPPEATIEPEGPLTITSGKSITFTILTKQTIVGQQPLVSPAGTYTIVITGSGTGYSSTATELRFTGSLTGQLVITPPKSTTQSSSTEISSTGGAETPTVGEVLYYAGTRHSGANPIRLDFGKVHVRCLPSLRCSGGRITTPRVQVTWHGTEFEVEVANDGETTVTTFEGTVDVQDITTGASIPLGNNTMIAIPNQSAGFQAQQLQQMVTQVSLAQVDQWWTRQSALESSSLGSGQSSSTPMATELLAPAAFWTVIILAIALVVTIRKRRKSSQRHQTPPPPPL